MDNVRLVPFLRHVPQMGIYETSWFMTSPSAPCVTSGISTSRHHQVACDWFERALQHCLAVLSRDEHFDGVPGLRRETW